MFCPPLCFKVLHQKVVLVCRASITISPTPDKKILFPQLRKFTFPIISSICPKHSTVTASVESCAYANIRVSWRRLSQCSQNSSPVASASNKDGGMRIWGFGTKRCNSFFFYLSLPPVRGCHRCPGQLSNWKNHGLPNSSSVRVRALSKAKKP